MSEPLRSLIDNEAGSGDHQSAACGVTFVSLCEDSL
jgi:hypothetical protein